MEISACFPYLFPLVLVAWLAGGVGARLFGLSWREPRRRLIILLLAALITFWPVAGLSLAEGLLSLNPNFAIGSLALMGLFLWVAWGGRPLLPDRSLRNFCLWNVTLSLAVFAGALGFAPVDLYAQGYHFSAVFGATALATVWLIWRNSRLQYIFLAYIAAFNLKVLPSPNYIDYLTDGFLFAASLLTLLWLAWGKRTPPPRTLPPRPDVDGGGDPLPG